MKDLDSSRSEILQRLADELGFSISESGMSDAIDKVEELSEGLHEPEPERTRESIGSMADDPYNSLLNVYDEPRVECDDGPLAGITVAIKDVIATKDLRMTCGSRGFEFVPSRDAVVVERLLDAGAAIVGKNNTDAFAFGPTGEFSEFDDVVNPIAPDRIPGGSSSGSAASVAGDVVNGALGTDTGGSVRIPAACCGVVGVKPTRRTTPRAGFVDLAPSTDTIGTFGRDVESAGALLEAIRGFDVRDPSSVPVSGPVTAELDGTHAYSLAVLDPFVERSSDTVTETFENAVNRLSSRESISVARETFDFGWLDEAFPLFVMSEYAWLLRQGGVIRGQGTQYDAEWRRLSSKYREALNEHIGLRVLPAAILDSETEGYSYVAARQEATRFYRVLADFFAEYDAVVLPTMRVLPPKLGEVSATEGMRNISGNTAPFSLTGHPSTSVPCGNAEGLSVGLQIVAPEFEDARTLGVASLVEADR
jgi:Asp-tRNA(Asn)/Glu-tRNA(Gln) amidotransferase A subunit family amidase